MKSMVAKSMEPRSFVLASPGVRIRRFGAAFTTTKLLAQLAASVVVLVGLLCLMHLGLRDDGGVMLMTFVVLSFAALGTVPLVLALIPTWLAALFAGQHDATVRVTKQIRVERGDAADAFEPAHLARIDEAPGGLVLRFEDGDTIHVETDDRSAAVAIGRAVAESSGTAQWIARLHEHNAKSSKARVAAIIGVGLAMIDMLWLDGEVMSAGLLTGMGALAWLTILRPSQSRETVAIGTDGVAIKSFLSDRFIPFSAIERIEETSLGAVLVLTRGERVALTVIALPRVATAGDVALAEGRRTTLLARLRAGLGAAEPAVGEERLCRRGRSMSAWRAAVREIVKDDAMGYRDAPLPKEHAARIVENGRATPDARIGAALALAGRIDQPMLRRLRIAVEACADEPTQHALQQALEGRLDAWALDYAERSRKHV